MIRPATLVDLSPIVGLYQHLTREMAVLAPTIIQPLAADNRDYFARYIMEDLADVLINVDEAQNINGFALVVAAKTEAAPEVVAHDFAYLIDLVVAPTARHQGIGSALLGAVDAWSLAHQLEYVQLNVLPQNTDAIQLYEKWGYQAAQITMTRPLATPTDRGNDHTGSAGD
ncbi:GNAT family N-acetyltransferase [Lacticaseibacillus brantae]|uniref:GNAT family acetyltransferase protein n=1 Tax=Lacticaseibacillus brantae DSM 23927 TaxID=1423727 RepID=A0A0R2BBB7_9LACO|nr:GNAT family N-acetyltransferase [Lacticaseibacillus brantae]KRM73100.1 GNAT family acetyltransferase protein [Lacticaseibacillus brantae DSM 23927]